MPPHWWTKPPAPPATRGIPTTNWLALFLVAILSLGSMGFHAGLTGTAGSVIGMGTILNFVVVMRLIADLDHPLERVLRVNQRGMIDLRETMKGESTLRFGPADRSPARKRRPA